MSDWEAIGVLTAYYAWAGGRLPTEAEAGRQGISTRLATATNDSTDPPDAQWTWYASEFDGEDIFFGLVSGMEIEPGYFSLKEMQEVRGPLGLPIERDLNFD